MHVHNNLADKRARKEEPHFAGDQGSLCMLRRPDRDRETLAFGRPHYTVYTKSTSLSNPTALRVIGGSHVPYFGSLQIAYEVVLAPVIVAQKTRRYKLSEVATRRGSLQDGIQMEITIHCELAIRPETA